VQTVQADPAGERPAHVGAAPRGMADQSPPLDALRERAPVGFALASAFWLQAMQLASMPHQRGDAHQPRVIRRGRASYGRPREYPRVHTMGLPYLGELPACLLEPKLLPKSLGFPSLLNADGSQLLQGVVEPVFAHLQWGERAVPLPSQAFAGARFDVLHDKAADRKERTEPGRQSQFPLPACLCRRGQFLLALVSVLTGLTARGLAIAPGAAHAGALLFGFLYACAGSGLDVEIGMGCRHDAIAFALGTRIKADHNGLPLSCRRVDVEPDTEDAAFPKSCRFAIPDPPPRSRGRRGHQRALLLIDHRNKHRCHVR